MLLNKMASVVGQAFRLPVPSLAGDAPALQFRCLACAASRALYFVRFLERRAISSVVERLLHTDFQRVLTLSPNALYIGKIETPFDPIYHCQYQI
jgi:hypothetical protein